MNVIQYVKTIWRNKITQLNSTNMNHIEDGIGLNRQYIGEMNETVENMETDVSDAKRAIGNLDESCKNLWLVINGSILGKFFPADGGIIGDEDAQIEISPTGITGDSNSELSGFYSVEAMHLIVDGEEVEDIIKDAINDKFADDAEFKKDLTIVGDTLFKGDLKEKESNNWFIEKTGDASFNSIIKKNDSIHIARMNRDGTETLGGIYMDGNGMMLHTYNEENLSINGHKILSDVPRNALYLTADEREVISEAKNIHGFFAGTASGDPIRIEGTTGTPLNGLEVYGKSGQVVTTGAQLISIVDGTQTQNGVEIVRKNGEIRLNGTASGDTWFTTALPQQIEAGTKLYLSANNQTGANCTMYLEGEYDEQTVINLSTPNIGKSFTLANTVSRFVLRLISGVTYNNFIIKPMLQPAPVDTTGWTPKPFEPYTASLPSPSPDYPQEIDVPGWVCKGNQLLDCSLEKLIALNPTWTWNDNKATKSGVTVTFNDDGTFLATGATTESSAALVIATISLNTGKYYISGCPSGGGNQYYIDIFRNSPRLQFADFGNGEIVNGDSNGECQARIVVKSNTTITNLLFKPMLQKYVTRNLVTMPNVTTTEKGITIVRNNGTVTLSGTMPSEYPNPTEVEISVGQYTVEDTSKHFFTGFPSGDGIAEIIGKRTDTWEWIYTFTKDGTVFTPSSRLVGKTVDFRVRIRPGVVVNTSFTPRIVKGDHAVPDPVPYPFEPFGSGVNEIDLSEVSDKTTWGIPFTVDATKGTIIVGTGTLDANNDIWFNIDNIPVKRGERYFLAGCPKGLGSAFEQYVVWPNGPTYTDKGNGVEFVAENTDSVNFRIHITKGTVISSPIVFYPMLTELPFSNFPYSPYAEDGGNVAKFNRVDCKIIQINQLVWEDGFALSEQGTAVANANFCISNFIECSHGHHIFTFIRNENVLSTVRVHGYDKNKGWIKQLAMYTYDGTTIVANTFDFYVNDMQIEFIRISIRNSTTDRFLDNNVKQTASLPTPTGLPGIPLADDATDYTYIDGNDKKWIADTIEYDGEKCWRVKRIGIYRPKAVTEFQNALTNTKEARFHPMPSDILVRNRNSLLCNYAIQTDGGSTWNVDTLGIMNFSEQSSDSIAIRVNISDTANDISDLGIVIYYILANQIREEITDPDFVETIKSLCTNEEYTEISTSDHNGRTCFQRADYFKDTRTSAEKRYESNRVNGSVLGGAS